MNLFLAIDGQTATDMNNLAPHKNMIDINSPRQLSKVASLPKPAVSTIANWVSHKRDNPISKEQKEFLKSLAT